MKIAIITSTDYLEEFASLGTMDMALAPLCLKRDRSDFNQKYCDYFRKRSKEGYFVLMDNGAYEKELLDNDLLLEISNNILPSCVVAPDKLRDSQETIRKTFDFLESEAYKKLPKKTAVMAVPQGLSLSEYIESYRLFAFDPRIDFIGLNFVSNFEIPGKEDSIIKDIQQMNNRLALVNFLEQNNLVNREKKHHLLGLASPLELNNYKDKDWIYSNDSSCAFIHGAFGVKIDKENGLIDISTNNIVRKSTVDIKDFEYGYYDPSKQDRSGRPLVVNEAHKQLVIENCNILLDLVKRE